jgi:hypothetical protein
VTARKVTTFGGSADELQTSTLTFRLTDNSQQ